MRLYANYPSYPFRSSPHTNLFAHQHPRPSPPTSAPTSQAPRSVIRIPVFDSASPAPPPPSPRQKKDSVAPLLDPVSAATRIQSCFRGHFIRRHHPLNHLRTISSSRKQLEDLTSELESPGFSSKVKSNERGRLRFSESIMAVILRLDAIEGSIPEVRNQRKEATKMAIKLQDAMDAILSLQEEVAGSKSANSELAADSESNPWSDAHPRDVHNMMQEAATTIQEEGPDRVEAVNHDFEDRDQGVVLQDGPAEVTDDVQEELIKAVNNAGLRAAQDESVDSMVCVENNSSCRQAALSDSSEGTGVQTAGIDGTCTAMVSSITPCKKEDQNMQEETRCVMADDNAEITNSLLGNDIVAHDKSYKSINVCREDAEDLSPGTPCAEDRYGCSPIVEELLNPRAPNSTHEQMQDKTPAGIKIVSDDGLQDLDALPGVGVLPPSESVLLKKLSEEYRQLKFMLGKLLAQSKAQSKVICALGDRLEMLEHQQQLGCQNNQQRGKKKGSKKRVKCRNDDLRL